MKPGTAIVNDVEKRHRRSASPAAAVGTSDGTRATHGGFSRRQQHHSARTAAAASRVNGPMWTGLPTAALERRVLEHVSLVDLGALYWCRPGAVLRHLTGMRVLCYEPYACDDAKGTCWGDSMCAHDAGFGARLALRWCANLTRMTLRRRMSADAFVAFVVRNRATLRRLDGTEMQWSNLRGAWAATHCPQLETFGVAVGTSADQHAPFQVAVSVLARVHDLTLLGDSDGVRFRALLFRELPWRLRALTTRHHVFTAAQFERTLARFTALERLSCAVALRGDPNGRRATSEPDGALIRHAQVRGVLGCLARLRRLASLRLAFEAVRRDNEERRNAGDVAALVAAHADERMQDAVDDADEIVTGNGSSDAGQTATTVWRLDALTDLDLAVRHDFASQSFAAFAEVELVTPSLLRYDARYVPMTIGVHALTHSPRLERFRHCAVEDEQAFWRRFSSASRGGGGGGDGSNDGDFRGAALPFSATERLRAALQRSSTALAEIEVAEDESDRHALTADVWAQLCAGVQVSPDASGGGGGGGGADDDARDRDARHSRWPRLERLSAKLRCEPTADGYVRAVGRILAACPAMRYLTLVDAHDDPTLADQREPSVIANPKRHTDSCGYRRTMPGDRTAVADDNDRHHGAVDSAVAHGRIVASELRELHLSLGTGDFWTRLVAPRLATMPTVACDHDVTAALRTCAHARSTCGPPDASGEISVHLQPGVRVALRLGDDAGLSGTARLLVTVASHAAYERVDAPEMAAATRGLLSWTPDVTSVTVYVSPPPPSAFATDERKTDDGAEKAARGEAKSAKRVAAADQRVLGAVIGAIFDATRPTQLRELVISESLRRHPAVATFRRSRPNVCRFFDDD